MSGEKWRPISTASRGARIVRRDGNHEHGEYVLVYPFFGEVVRAHWWQYREPDGQIDSCNFLTDGGNACFPTHWMPIPEPPEKEELNQAERDSSGPGSTGR